MKRCAICNLPENFPGISFDGNGVCSICRKKTKPPKYLGLKAMQDRVQEILEKSDPNREYDCIVGLSGGRDSSYLLYFAKRVLNLRVLAITLDHDFMPEQTKKNIELLTENLSVDIQYIPNNSLNKSSRKCIRTWSKHPDAAMCVTFCTGCRYGIKKTIPAYARDHHIPILLVGDTPYEQQGYRVNLLCKHGDKFDTKAKVLGYISELMENPRFLLSPMSMYAQLLDFFSYEGKRGENVNPVTVMPFYHYIEWNEDEVIPAIQSLGWKYDESLNSSWRSDCYVNVLRQYYYKRLLGFNDLDGYYANMIRKGEITKEEALKRIEDEGRYDEEAIKDILSEYYDLDFDEINVRIEAMDRRS